MSSVRGTNFLFVAAVATCSSSTSAHASIHQRRQPGLWAAADQPRHAAAEARILTARAKGDCVPKRDRLVEPQIHIACEAGASDALCVVSKHPMLSAPAASAEAPAVSMHVVEFMWLLALWALNRAFVLSSCEQKRSSLNWLHISWSEDKSAIEVKHPSSDIVEKKFRNPEAVVQQPAKVVELQDRTQADSKRVEERVEDLRSYHRHDAEVLRKCGRALPALASRRISAVHAKDLRTTVLKQQASRSMILQGISELIPAVTQDCEANSRASLALADFHFVRGQFGDLDEDGDQLQQQAAQPGSPAWKRLCRVVSFLQRNSADA